MNELLRSHSDKNLITSDELQNLIKTKFPSAKQQKELYTNFALWLRTQEILYKPGSVSIDVSNTPMDGSFSSVYNIMAYMITGQSMTPFDDDGGSMHLPGAVNNSGMEMVKLRGVYAVRDYNKAKDTLKRLAKSSKL